MVYLDHNASVPVPEQYLSELNRLTSIGFANPSSLHTAGRASRRLINDATESAAAFVDCDAEFIYWTSGASEANSWALHSAFETALYKGRKPRFLISAVEHESVALAAKYYQSKGAEIHIVPVGTDGVIDYDKLKALFETDSNWDLLSVMYANNESGVMQPIRDLVHLANKHSIPTHVDCVQALGKIPVSVKRLEATYTTFSGHKIGALKGVGFLAIHGKGRILWPLIHGKQQKSLRGGTENPVNVAFFGIIMDAIRKGELAIDYTEFSAMRNKFEEELVRLVPGAVIHGKAAKRLPNTTYVGFEGTDGDGVLVNLDLEGICASSGSACTSGSLDPSSVLLAMGCGKEMARSSVRFSSGRGTTWKDYEKVLEVLPDIVSRVRGLT